MLNKILRLNLTLKIIIFLILSLFCLFFLRENFIWPFTEHNQNLAYLYKKFGTIKKDVAFKSESHQSFFHDFNVRKYILDNQIVQFDIAAESDEIITIYGISYRNSHGKWDKPISLNKVIFNKHDKTIKTSFIKEFPDFEISKGFLAINSSNFLISYVYFNTKDNCRELRMDSISLIGDNFDKQKNLYASKCVPGLMHMVGGGLEKDTSGNIYLGIGDFMHPDYVIDSSDDFGKILKFSVNEKTYSHYALGVRNPQSLTWSDSINKLIESEHGPKGGDEINIIKKDKHYGWPFVSYGIPYGLDPKDRNFSELKEKIKYINQNDKRVYKYLTHDGYEKPLRTFLPDIGIKGIQVMPFNSTYFKNWAGDLFITSSYAGSLVRIRFEDHKFINQELIYNDQMGRGISISPSGIIFISSTKGETLDIITLD